MASPTPPPETQSDDDLLIRIRDLRASSDPTDLHEADRLCAVLYRRHLRKMMLLGSRITGDRRAAESIAGLVFVKACRAYETGGNFRNYLLRSVVNVARSSADRRHQTLEVPLVHEFANADGLWVAPRLSPRAGIVLQEAIDELHRETERTIVRMWMVGHSWEEIAQATGRKKGSLKSNFHRSLGKLSGILERKGFHQLLDLLEG